MGDLFDGIEKAEPRKQAVYLTDGIYEDLEVLAAKTGRTRNEGAFFAVEFRVVKSSGPKALPPGSTCSLMTMKSWDGFGTDVRTWVAAIFNGTFEKVTGDFVRMVTTEANPAKGAHVRVEAWSKITKKNKVPFTQSAWTHLSLPDGVKERFSEAKAELARRAKEAAEALAREAADAAKRAEVNPF